MVCKDLFIFLLRTESRSKREKESVRDNRDYDSEVLSLRDARDDRDTREARDRRDARDRGRETTRDNRDIRDAKDSRESRTETRSSRESLERREKERGRERERSDAYRKEDPAQDDRVYVRAHGRDDGGRADVRTESRTDRAERNDRGRGRATESSDKGKC